MENHNFRYIDSIKLEGFCGNKRLEWSLSQGINILSGSNGSGKSTLIHALIKLFRHDSFSQNIYKPYDKIIVNFSDGSSITSKQEKTTKNQNVDIISTFDMPLKISEAVQHLSSSQVITDLDWELYRCQERYLRFQLYLGKQVINSLVEGKDKVLALEITRSRDLFLDMIDEMFSESRKKVVRDSEDLLFDVPTGRITPFQLSSGEKQLLIILITTLIQDNKESILIMDEPEISLHHLWQRQLIQNIVTLNPKVQLITTTHSPALIMDGWMDNVVDISEIISE